MRPFSSTCRLTMLFCRCFVRLSLELLLPLGIDQEPGITRRSCLTGADVALVVETARTKYAVVHNSAERTEEAWVEPQLSTPGTSASPVDELVPA